VPIDRATIVHVADLARIGLTEEEIDRFTGQLSVVLDAVERLGTVDTSAISPTASTLPLVGVQRDDVIRPGLTTDEALANAPRGGRDGEFFRVQEILEGR
jgi:aspartyl-tRNA(Asn)/glutamyl-tRNA(Gln) amidotransferase subunit C